MYAKSLMKMKWTFLHYILIFVQNEITAEPGLTTTGTGVVAGKGVVVVILAAALVVVLGIGVVVVVLAAALVVVLVLGIGVVVVVLAAALVVVL